MKIIKLFFIVNLSHVFADFILDETNFKLNRSLSLIPPFTTESTERWFFRNASLTNTNSIALTPRKTGKWGSVWNRLPITSESWKIVLRYSAYSNQLDLADGIALWYTPESYQWDYQGSHHVYGGPKQNFTGFMIAIDNLRLDSPVALNRTRNEAAVIVVYNKVPRFYDWFDEGFSISETRFVVQNRYFNDTNNFATLAVEYVDNELRVYHTKKSKELYLCGIVHNLKLPKGYILGVSAGNGGIIGAYEIHSFLFYEDKRCTCDVQIRKLSTNIYITYGLLAVVTSVLIGLSSFLMINRFKGQQTNEPESSISERRQRTRHSSVRSRQDVTCQNRELRELNTNNLPSVPPRKYKRDSANYVDVETNELNSSYDHIVFKYDN